MLDGENLDQQEALGIVGVNLIHGAFFKRKDLKSFIGSLVDDLTPVRIEIDMIRFSGPDFAMVDNRIMCLELVTQGLAQAVLFRGDGEVIQAADLFHHKPLLVERGSFRPVTKVHRDMIECAHAMFLTEENLAGEEPEAIGLPLGIPSLHEVFEEKYYGNLDGGILEGLGRLFKKGVRLYVYPTKDEKGHIIEAASYKVEASLHTLYAYLLENRYIVPMAGCKLEYLGINSEKTLAKLQSGDAAWEAMVPPEVAEIIKTRKFFGWKE